MRHLFGSNSSPFGWSVARPSLGRRSASLGDWVGVRHDAAAQHVGARLSAGTVAWEWALLFGVVLFFCHKFLDLGTYNALLGNEAEFFQVLDWTLVNSLAHYGQIPLWNPYLRAGLPVTADPYLHLYNPLVTVPVLLLGVMDGFKGNRHTLARGMEANPLVIEFDFPTPRALSSLALHVGSMDLNLRVLLYEAVDGEPVTYQRTYVDLPFDPQVELAFDKGPERASRLRVEIQDMRAGERANVHVRDLRLR